MTDHWLALNLIPGLGPRRVMRLLDKFSSIENVFEAEVQDLVQIQGITTQHAYGIKKTLGSEKHLQEKSRLEKHGIRLIEIRSDDYPALLKSIFAPPPLLFVKGQLDFNQGLPVAFVGARKATYNGKIFCRKLIRGLAEMDSSIVIVSGLALGIDTEAHKAALEFGLKTVAVLAGGLLNVYPRQNQKLFEAISENGAVISEFSTLTNPTAGHFPLRNRVISGMSKGLMVVEASESSGALISAKYTLEQERKLFAMPGNADISSYLGNNRLLQDGSAKLVLTPEDLYQDLVGHQKINPQAVENQQLDFSRLGISKEEEAILALLEKESLNQDLIATKLDMPIHKVLALITPLVMKGLIISKPGSIYQAVGF
ncbi:MAG: DNA-processing protein DprA [Deltaproteobacteria bacterium]|nr:DNA-processing protein DprA [Deltaproteobacteria bacterium]